MLKRSLKLCWYQFLVRCFQKSKVKVIQHTVICYHAVQEMFLSRNRRVLTEEQSVIDLGVPYLQPVVLPVLFSWLGSQQKILQEAGSLRDQCYTKQDQYRLFIAGMRIFSWLTLGIRKKLLPYKGSCNFFLHACFMLIWIYYVLVCDLGNSQQIPR